MNQKTEPLSAKIRPATESDLAAINDIYNHYVLHSTCTYQEEPEPLVARREWFAHHGEKHPVIVASVNGQVIGWGSLSAYHARSAYRNTVENSIYVHHQHHRRGMGALLLKDLIVRAITLGHHAIIAGIDAEQAGSVALHDRFGFQQVGRFKQVGYKFGQWLDVIYMELILDPASPPQGKELATGSLNRSGEGAGQNLQNPKLQKSFKIQFPRQSVRIQTWRISASLGKEPQSWYRSS